MFRPLLLCDKIVLEAKEQVCRKEKVRTQKHESGRRKESDHTLPLRVPAEKNVSAFVAGWMPGSGDDEMMRLWYLDFCSMR